MGVRAGAGAGIARLILAMMMMVGCMFAGTSWAKGQQYDFDAQCNNNEYSYDDIGAVKVLLHELGEAKPYGGQDETERSARFWARAHCDASVSNNVCHDCISQAVTLVTNGCNRRLGAHAFNPTCKVQYEDHEF